MDGATLGGLLAETGVLLLSMNACRSADSAGGDRHLRAEPVEAPGQPSIAEEVLAAGVPACVGMGREVYPGTPSRFFAVFYTAFFGGDSPGEAARVARARLYAEPLTAGVYREASPPIDDWCIPVVHERVAVRLASLSPGDLEVPADPLTAVFPEELLAPPVVGFDRAILTLETRLADARVVLVYGGLLAGKSRLAAEYARWFSATSPEPRPVAYLRLDDGGDLVPDSGGDLVPDDLGGGLLVVDQADHAGPAAGELVRRLSGTGRVIVTARSPNCHGCPRTSGSFQTTFRWPGGPRWARSGRVTPASSTTSASSTRWCTSVAAIPACSSSCSRPPTTASAAPRRRQIRSLCG